MLRLNNQQLNRLSEITGNTSLVFLGSVLAPIFSNVDNVDPFNIVLGLIGAITSLVTSLHLMRGTKR